jgi:hypothetical protein
MSTRQTAMKRNYPGKLLKDLSPGAQAVYERLKAPFVLSRLSRTSCRGRLAFWILPATGLRAGFWGLITSDFCPHLSTSGSLLCFSTRKSKYQQKPIITSPFVFTDCLSHWLFFFIVYHPEKMQREIIL